MNPDAPTFVRAAVDTAIFSTEHHESAYHYTTLEGLMGICTSWRIWATDVRYMNDASAYIYAQSVIEDVVSEYSAPLRKNKGT